MEGYFFRFSSQEEQEMFPKIGKWLEGEISGTLRIYIPEGVKEKYGK